jgi:EAL domain-containing protein (putative c-di-GMP-specific phosphodiesterase class I)
MLFSAYENSFIFYVKSYETINVLEDFCRAISDTLKSVLAAEGIAYGIGVYVIDNAKRLDAEQILKNLMMISEIAMSNQDRGLQTHYFDESIERQILRDLQLRNELDNVCAENHDGGLFLQFQPIFDLPTNRICGFEALARLRSDTLGLVPPLEFIPMAEKTKLILPIGDKVMLQALRFLKELEFQGFPDICMTINVSVLQLLQGGFCTSLFEKLQRLDISPDRIGLELTESIFASDYLEINRTLAILKNAGMHIAIDDFGTGYSSLAREWELNVDCLKIDKSFVQNLMDFPPEKSIISDIISMAHRFDHYVVAEGVEYESQRDLLKQWGCDKIQGYLISRPLDPEGAIKLLKEQGRAVEAEAFQCQCSDPV